MLGFCKMISKLVLERLLRGELPRLVLVFDAGESKTFRHEMFNEYKSNRPPCPIDLVPQFDLVREAASAYCIPQFEVRGPMMLLRRSRRWR